MNPPVIAGAIVVEAELGQPGLAGIAEPAGRRPLRHTIFVVAVGGAADEVARAVRKESIVMTASVSAAFWQFPLCLDTPEWQYRTRT